MNTMIIIVQILETRNYTIEFKKINAIEFE